MRTRVRPLAECGGTKIMATGGNKSTGFTISDNSQRWCSPAVIRPQSRFARTSLRSAGFTIVETLIVLAVSALVAVSAMLVISGRQSETQFMVASNDLKQKIEQIINETRSGYYPGSGDFSCTGSVGTKPTINNITKSQGTNGGCIFLGKAVEFGFSQTGADPESFATYPLVGNQQDTITHHEVSSYSQAMPIALSPDSSNNTNGVNHGDFLKTENGLTFKKATYHLSSGGLVTSTTQAAFAFADSLGDYAPNATTGDLNSATEKLNLYYFSAIPNWSAVAQNSGGVVDGINSGNVNDVDPTLNSLDLCFDGGTGKTATITITGLGQLSVKLKISSSVC